MFDRLRGVGYLKKAGVNPAPCVIPFRSLQPFRPGDRCIGQDREPDLDLSLTAQEDTVNPLESLRQAADTPGIYATLWKQQTGKMVLGHFCSYFPEEMATAAGMLAYRILPSGRTISRADAHLQSYGCHLVRSTLEDALAGDLNFLDGVVFPHTCDTIQRLSDIWRMNLAFAFHSDLMVPATLHRESSVDYLAAVLAAFRNELASRLDVPVTAEALCAAIELHNRIRAAMCLLYRLRSEAPGLLPGRDWLAVSRACMVMERAALADHLTELVAVLEAIQNTGNSSRTAPYKRVVLSGGICTVPDIHAAIEGAGGAVVWDELCTGARYFDGRVATDTEPEKALAAHYAHRLVCPAKHRGITTRGDDLVAAVERNRAQGVVFLVLKFCDPHAFDYPYMKQMLDDHGIPGILIEIEDPARASEQVRTRCEAFIEMI